VVHSVDNGREAVACLAEGARPDLVFMDIHMPVMDGYQATREIRRREQRQQLSRVPIIALSASVTMEEQSVCRDAGMDGFLGKPLALDQLQQLLRRWLPVAGQPAARAQTPASAPAAGYAVDAAGQVATIAHDLLTELAQHKYDAVGRFADLRAALGEAEGAAEVAAAERCVETFDFEGARELLRKTAIAQGWIGEML
jgi:CheY-like chemotaxis protein